MDKVAAFFKQILAFWNSLPTGKRLALLIVTSGVLASVLLLSAAGQRFQYAYLYTELSPQDAAGIVEKLKSLEVPHRIEANGTAILVPDEKVAELRLQLAGSGLPRGGGVGFEIFDESQIGATEFEQQVNLRRALEGELVRSVITVDGVKSARVHLVMPKRKLFTSREESASASVVLKLTNPQAFGKKEVAAIVHLVAAAVPGLRRDRVSVVSTDGITLHRPNTGDEYLAGDIGEATTERAQAVSNQLENDVRAQIERVVGAGNADVRIAVELDPSSRELTEEHFEPSKTALRSEQKVEEMSAATAAGVAGVPGAVANLPDAMDAAEAAPAPAGVGEGDVFRRSQTRNWEVDRVAQKTITPAGSVSRLSVAVLLNGRYVDQGGSSVYRARAPEELQQLEALVKHAVGFSEKRGDTVTVANAEFVQTPLDIGEPIDPPLAWRQFIPYAAAFALLVFVFAVVVLVKRGKRTGRARPKAYEGGVQQLEAGAEGAASLPNGGAPNFQLPQSQAVDSEALRNHALTAAGQDAPSAALVLRGWLNGGTAPQAGAKP